MLPNFIMSIKTKFQKDLQFSESLKGKNIVILLATKSHLATWPSFPVFWRELCDCKHSFKYLKNSIKVLYSTLYLQDYRTNFPVKLFCKFSL